tara:strand:- start:1155 stop:1694 length:540 start_codon:yes stop_codon:yes gene_type:complete
MNPLKVFVSTLFVKDYEASKIDEASFYDIKINTISGEAMNLNDYKDKFILVVNVASKCGFTSQYEDLQKLFEQYKNKLVVIGVPCNQFGSQEPGHSDEIKSFCKLNYGVTFPITEKINVKGKQQHKLYKWLTNKVNNGTKNSSVKWNFQKYLIDKNGKLVDYYFSSTNPLSSKITNHIK